MESPRWASSPRSERPRTRALTPWRSSSSSAQESCGRCFWSALPTWLSATARLDSPRNGSSAPREAADLRRLGERWLKALRTRVRTS